MTQEEKSKLEHRLQGFGIGVLLTAIIFFSFGVREILQMKKK